MDLRFLTSFFWAFGVLWNAVLINDVSANSLVALHQLQQRSDDRQNIVTWDEYSLMVHGKRVLILSGEMHPWRLPVPSLWLDVFEKIRAAGFNTVSFYVHWGLIEYAKDDFNFNEWLGLESFFAAAKKTGTYLIARPGPYINAETTGGGTPGWGTRVPGAWRTENQTYLDAMEAYVRRISKILEPAQITNGGPVILVQPENEYSYCFETPRCPVPWPQPRYMQRLQDLMREEGIVVPTISNEVQYTSSNYAPGSGIGEVDIRGYDNYPLGFICNDTSNWPDGKLLTKLWETHRNISGKNPNSILEMQAGAHGRWGWFSHDDCATFIGSEFVRVFYKNYIAASTTIINLYMMYGGTNWGGIASTATFTSYDYGGPIKENRLVTREKYSELKLLAQFLQVSPAYLTTKPLNTWPVNTVNGSEFTDNPSLAITQLADVVGNRTVFWVARHAAYNSLESSMYKLNLPTSRGKFSIPVLSGRLRLSGRDSKIHVTDYDIGGIEILYSSAEVLTWKKFSSKTILILYGSKGEVHETAFNIQGRMNPKIQVLQGENAIRKAQSTANIATVNFEITDSQAIVNIDTQLQIVIVDRKAAFGFWAPGGADGPAIVHGPYLVRSAKLSKSGVLGIRGDLNVSRTEIEVFTDDKVRSVIFNGREQEIRRTKYDSIRFAVRTNGLKISLPDLGQLDWKYVEGLPEVKNTYDDERWPDADLRNSTNPRRPTTPTSLYSSDYGFHTGNILWRGHFVASGREEELTIGVQGGAAFAASIWIDGYQLGFHYGRYGVAAANITGALPKLDAGSKHVITVILDHMGIEQNYGPGGDLHKIPRGILNYGFKPTNLTNVKWKLTGNLGGEKYLDRVRGPVNEGGLYPERHGLHQPGVDASSWERGSPLDGLSTPGVRFYSATFRLHIPPNLDVPLSFNFGNKTGGGNYRAQLYVNGYQFGKFASNLGPQTKFPVPEGILNNRGENTVALSLWAMDYTGAKVEGFELQADAVVETSMESVEAVPQPRWTERRSAY